MFLLLIFEFILLQIFVGGIDPDVTDEDLRQPFSQFGEVVSVKIPVGKGCGFVQFSDRCSLHLFTSVGLSITCLSNQ